MELRRRTDAFMKPRPVLPAPPTSAVTRNLCEFEHLSAQRLWIRGIMSLAALLAFILSLFNVESYAGGIVIHVFILLISLGGEVCIVLVYQVWAKYSGITNKAANPPSPNALHSQYRTGLYVEMFVWIIHCPPGLNNQFAWAMALDYFIILRFYVVVLFFTNLTITHHSFSRAMSSLSSIPLSTSLFLRTCLFTYRLPQCLFGGLVFWILQALLYSKAEASSFLDSLYFCVSTSAFIGFGDISPVTFGGRFVAFFAWMQGVTILVWVIGMLRHGLKLTEPEEHMYALFRANELCSTIPYSAAVLIQRSWRFHRAVRGQRNAALLQLSSWWVSRAALAFREERRELVDMEYSFLDSIKTFDDYLRDTLSPQRSRGTSAQATPSQTPRGRRRFHHFRAMTPQMTPQQTPQLTPRAGAADASMPETTPKQTEAEKLKGALQPSAGHSLQTTVKDLAAATAVPEGDVEHRVAKVEKTLDSLIALTEKLIADVSHMHPVSMGMSI